MRLLLDTQVILWHLNGERELSSSAQEAIAAADDVLLSTVSFAEMGIKRSVGKLEVPDEIHRRITESGVRVLALSPEHGLAVSKLPTHHRDPFDRLLISQASIEGLSVVTADPRFGDYEIDVVPA